MKIGISGTPKEIKSFLVDNGFNARDFIELPKKYEWKWVMLPTSLFIGISFILWIINKPSDGLFGLLVIIELLLICCITIYVHLLFKSPFANILCLFILILIFSFCAKFIDLREVIRIVREKYKI